MPPNPYATKTKGRIPDYAGKGSIEVRDGDGKLGMFCYGPTL